MFVESMGVMLTLHVGTPMGSGVARTLHPNWSPEYGGIMSGPRVEEVLSLILM